MEPAGVLGVFGHPDDESLAAGGLLARQAAAGARTGVVTATWAEGTHRVPELARALAELGAGAPRLLGYADARVPESAPGAARLLDVPVERAVRQLVGHLREFRPDWVVTHDAHGGMTGHPDHRRTHRLALLAVRAAALPGRFPELGGPWRVRRLLCATHPHSAARALGPLLLRPGRTAHTVPDEEVTALDVSPWLERKLAAVFAHRSEVARGALPGRLAAAAPADRVRMAGTEWYQEIRMTGAEWHR
ncbi:PIG-L deacetylase family protein [Kitasatospora cineracea]|uniref:N-acetyl-1-D-myo-inositol-2-amino-2-deoxy-alpha-D-glucopyranoside deacetylase n=1 Tax=Kitasatospora cineracea TaxID=88074 RepID=A0A8G1UBY5_9ACTN|nr:PIG-L deacetylase family protein [Kitasatospora cineracea]ROR37943.1 N-acetyl-1-D-myo-inositol-2-amino-2-deoxy-alpha-D-glucopyranoside deacetylase [Kitasatospora cineracea]